MMSLFTGVVELVIIVILVDVSLQEHASFRSDPVSVDNGEIRLKLTLWLIM